MGSGSREGSAYPPVKDRMSRARTPLGSVPISTIYGFDYPISNGIERDYSTKTLTDSVPPVERSTARKYVQAVPEVAPKTSSMTLSSTSPWDSTGFYYSPRYPQSHRGTASTYSSYSRRYPVRRFVPSYVPFRYSRR